MDGCGENAGGTPPRPYQLRRQHRVKFAEQSGVDSADNTVPCISRGKLYYQGLVQEHTDRGSLDTFRKIQNDRAKLYRQSMSEDVKKKDREGARNRMAEYRKRKKAKEEADLKTRAGHEKGEKTKQDYREKMKLYMRERRQTQSKEVKEADKEKRRRQYASKKASKAPAEMASPSLPREPVSGSPYKTPDALRKASARASTKDPEDPVKLASVRMHQMRAALRSPRKRQAMKNIGLHQLLHEDCQEKELTSLLSRIKQRLFHNKGKRDAASIKRRKLLVADVVAIIDKPVNVLAKELDLRWHFVKQSSVLPEEAEELEAAVQHQKTSEVNEAVLDFYDRPEVATVIPDRKSVKKDLVPKAVLGKTLKRLHKDFKEATGHQVSLSKFQKMRPQHVLTVGSRKKTSCLCIYCVNICQKLDAIKKETQTMDLQEAVDMTLCPKTGSHRDPACIARDCQNCGVHLLQANFGHLLPRKDITWLRWEVISKGDSGRTGNVLKKGTIADLIEELLVEMGPMANHMHTATWQYSQFRLLKNNLPDKWVMTVLDFSENYRCEYQQEIQSAHWSYDQVTVFPTVTYYKCHCGEMVTETVIVISPDLNHDASAVHTFSAAVMKHLQCRRQLEIKHQVQFTDGATSQFKSREPFMDLSMSAEDFGFTMERSFFGSYHGKGPCDGAGGVVKSAARRAVLAEEVVIRNALDMFQFMEKTYTTDPTESDCCHSRRVFLYNDTVNHKRPDRKPNNPMPGTRKAHSVVPVGPCQVQRKNLSCFCSECLAGFHDACPNQHITGSLASHSFNVPARKHTSAPPTARHAPPTLSHAPPTLSHTKPTPSHAPPTPSHTKPTPSHTKPTPSHAPPTMSHAPQTTSHAPTTTSHVPQTPSHAPPTPSHTKPTPSHTKPTMSHAPQTPSHAPPTTSHVPQTPSHAPLTQSHTTPTQSHAPLSSQARKSFFKRLQTSLLGKSFDEAAAVISEAAEELKRFPVRLCPRILESLKNEHTIDMAAAELWPSDAPSLTPISVYGDGNCLPRCLSLLTTDSQDHHPEMRVRIFMELVSGEQHYLSHKVLAAGHNHPRASKNLPSAYAQYSDHFLNTSKLCPATVQSIFRREAADILKPGVYMGQWQVHAAASVMGVPLHSIFPEYAGHTVRPDLNCMVLPRIPARDVPPFTAGIMWSHVQGMNQENISVQNWRPNHFVACVPDEVSLLDFDATLTTLDRGFIVPSHADDTASSITHAGTSADQGAATSRSPLHEREGAAGFGSGGYSDTKIYKKEGQSAPTAACHVRVGDFVEVNLMPVKAKHATAISYYGLIQALFPDGAEVRFLRKLRESKRDYFVWPHVDYIAFITLTEISSVLNVPQIDGRGRHIFY